MSVSIKDELWNNALNYLNEELGHSIYTEYIESITPLLYKNDVFVLQVPNEVHKSLLEKKYTILIENSLKFYTRKFIKVKFIVATSNDGISQTAEALTYEDASISESIVSEFNKQNAIDNTPKIEFNSKYTFDSFVIGPNNRFAHAASLAVAESPANKYNPLFIYGGVGLGKTHLMHAIAQQILKKEPTKKVVYVSSEQFTNEFIDAIQKQTNIKFRNKYRNVDVLLIDDIQFIAGKTETQNEFFHTFNDLHGSNKQIILTSDRPPKEIANLEERLRSRFGWGLICDVSAPDFETRVAILRQKAETENFEVSNEILTFIAENIKSNIRDLEGVLLKVKALSEFSGGKPLTLDIVRENLKDMIVIRDEKISLDLIIDIISDYYKVPVEDLLSGRRTKQIAYPRQIGMYLSRELTDNSLPTIGDFYGGRDHSTVIHGYDKIKTDIDGNDNFKKEIDRLINEIKTIR